MLAIINVDINEICTLFITVHCPGISQIDKKKFQKRTMSKHYAFDMLVMRENTIKTKCSSDMAKTWTPTTKSFFSTVHCQKTPKVVIF